MKNDKVIDSRIYIENLVLIANYIELGTRTIMRIAGNDISNKLDSGDLNNAISGLLAANLGKKLSHYN